MRVVYIGNFKPEHSTENHVYRALRNNGHDVVRLQEDDTNGASFAEAEQLAATCDLILWTRTGWGWADPESVHFLQRRMMRRARAVGTPVVGYHLDIWWGLKRESQVYTEPFFEVDLLCTADGGHDGHWHRAGINHQWMPPAVSEGEAQIGTACDEYRSKIAFVGSHDGSYHPEHDHRHVLVRWLRRNYPNDCAFWPKPGHHAVRGMDLQDLYASVDVVVGDSCFAGQGLANYWSDRIPETLGRGGFLLHPDVPGLRDHFPPDVLLTWEAGNWDQLRAKIKASLDDPESRSATTAAGRAHVLAHHTYEVRMRQLVEILNERHML